jgi:hypothetical protein
MSKFKKGDTVTANDYHLLDLGIKEGTLGVVQENDHKPWVMWEKGDVNPANGKRLWACGETCMRLVKSAWTPKAGDKVIVKSKTVIEQLEEYYYFIKNNPAINGYWIVDRINGDGSGRNTDNCIMVANKKSGYSGCFAPQDLELYVPDGTVKEPVEEAFDKQKKIAVHCNTLDEWKAVLDKLFGEGKKWCDNSTIYAESYFKGCGGEYDCILIDDNFICNTQEYFDNCIIIPAKEYLGEDINNSRMLFSGLASRLADEVAIGTETIKPLLVTSTPRKSELFEKLQEFQKAMEDYKEQNKEQNKKPNKIKQMTNNIVEFAKNLTLSADEKLLREVGLHDDKGCYTEDALNIALNLESVEIGYKSYQDLCDSVPEGCQFSLLEAAKLLKKYEVQLLDIAKKLKEESKSSKK